MTPLPAGRVAVLAAAILFAASPAAPGFAQDLSAIDMVNALKPKPKVRALDANQGPRESRQTDVINRLQRERTRGITVEEQEEIAELVADDDLPAIDLELFFPTDSAEIAAEALPTLESLGAALSDDQLKGSVFLVAGYADAEEADGMAQERAETVRSFLIDKFNIAPDRLVAIGIGVEDAPEGEKRRVRVVNMASRRAAKSGE